MQDKTSQPKAALVGATVAGILALSGQAANALPSAPTHWEKCAGVAKQGMNDCGSLNGSHGCASQSSADNDPNEWVYTPLGTCEKIGGKVAKVKPAK